MFRSILPRPPEVEGVKAEDKYAVYMSPEKGLLIFAGIGIAGAAVGATIGTYVYFGTVTLAGLIALIESNKHLKRIAVRSTTMIDLTIFAATLYATASLGVTVSAALVFAGLGYTLVYSPWLKKQKPTPEEKAEARRIRIKEWEDRVRESLLRSKEKRDKKRRAV